MKDLIIEVEEMYDLAVKIHNLYIKKDINLTNEENIELYSVIDDIMTELIIDIQYETNNCKYDKFEILKLVNSKIESLKNILKKYEGSSNFKNKIL